MNLPLNNKFGAGFGGGDDNRRPRNGPGPNMPDPHGNNIKVLNALTNVSKQLADNAVISEEQNLMDKLTLGFTVGTFGLGLYSLEQQRQADIRAKAAKNREKATFTHEVVKKLSINQTTKREAGLLMDSYNMSKEEKEDVYIRAQMFQAEKLFEKQASLKKRSGKGGDESGSSGVSVTTSKPISKFITKLKPSHSLFQVSMNVLAFNYLNFDSATSNSQANLLTSKLKIPTVDVSSDDIFINSTYDLL